MRVRGLRRRCQVRYRARAVKLARAALWMGLLSACGKPAGGESAPKATASAPVAAAVASPGTVPTCSARIAAARREAALPGAPRLEARRAEILARSKAEPVLMLRAPTPAADVSGEVEMYRRQLERSPSPGYTLRQLYKYLHNRQEIARALLLREGYLYADTPALAAALVDVVELHHLYREPEIRILRGSQTLRAQRDARGSYEYVDGPEAGKRARILLLDRVLPLGSDAGPPFHVSLRALAVKLAFDRMRVERITQKHVVASLRYGGDWVPTLLDVQGTELVEGCSAIPEEARARVEAARELWRRRERTLGAKRAAMVAMVQEALPFDEPKTEEGQQDGNLRPAWKWAYDHGWDSYTFNDDSYLVFDARGRPQVPQVCIDFITDTLERASGTWWTARDGGRQRTRGRIDFDQIGIENRRSVDVFVRFAKEHPEWFDVVELDADERVRFLERERFFAHLAQHADRYLPGDVVAIHGPRSDGENHWHSFFVYDRDPVTGMPLLTASNAGRPRIRSWEGEMRSAPLRSIRARVRFRLEWMEPLFSSDAAVSASEPAPLISAPI